MDWKKLANKKLWVGAVTVVVILFGLNNVDPDTAATALAALGAAFFLSEGLADGLAKLGKALILLAGLMSGKDGEVTTMRRDAIDVVLKFYDAD